MEDEQPLVKPEDNEVGMFQRLSLAMATVVMFLALTTVAEVGGLFLTEFGTEDVALG